MLSQSNGIFNPEVDFAEDGTGTQQRRTAPKGRAPEDESTADYTAPPR